MLCSPVAGCKAFIPTLRSPCASTQALSKSHSSTRVPSAIAVQRSSRRVPAMTVGCSSLPAAPATVGVASAALPPLESVAAILFDIDGTLTNSDPLHFEAFVEILMEKGFNGGAPIDEHFFRERISGRHNPDIAAELFPEWTVEQQAAFSEDKEQRYRKLAMEEGLEPVPGLPQFIARAAAAGVRMAAVTNAPRANAEAMLAALGLDATFEGVIYGEECARPKPFPDPYQEGLRLLGVDDPSRALVFEDSPSGIAAAVAAGIPVVAITSGHDPKRLHKCGPNLLVNDFDDVLRLLDQAALR